MWLDIQVFVKKKLLGDWVKFAWSILIYVKFLNQCRDKILLKFLGETPMRDGWSNSRMKYKKMIEKANRINLKEKGL